MKDVRYYGIYQFLKPKLIIRDPELIKSVTVKDFDYFTDHVAMVEPKADPLFGKNLLMLKGDDWKKADENFIQYFLNQPGDIIEIEAKETFARYTIDVIATTSFGVKVDSLNDRNNEFFRMGSELANISFTSFLKILLRQNLPTLYKMFKMTMFRKEVNDFFTALISDTVPTREKENIYRPDMLQNLIDARKKNGEKESFTIEDITAQAAIFFFAGFDSVSSVMSFTSYELALNQDIQDKLRKEILDISEENDGNITYDVIKQMKYLDMVICEVLRKWPPFVIIGRECTKTYVIDPVYPGEKKVVVPKGTAIQIPLYAIHHDPKYYPDPEKFIPERFGTEQKHQDKYFPFGQGPRACLGSRFALMEIKTIFVHILKTFKLVTTEKTQIPLKLVRKFSVNARPENGLYIGLQKL
ncbi:hypothetical protein GWI33_007992 [Rhynchophorus ferrugineus]|uniref:Cytochrome P450 n=1 Tax=Rhynchophorus ferrugineus TaxID=354439 RepID=A0A834MHU2_RHYFE|nr:hypothetical protein GWI33_007992 [Rhynchophorus ferrugineus]